MTLEITETNVLLHVTNTNRSINSDNIKILENGRNTNKKLFLEMYQVHKTEKT